MPEQGSRYVHLLASHVVPSNNVSHITLKVPPLAHVSSVQRSSSRRRAGSGNCSAEACVKRASWQRPLHMRSLTTSPSYLGCTRWLASLRPASKSLVLLSRVPLRLAWYVSDLYVPPSTGLDDTMHRYSTIPRLLALTMTRLLNAPRNFRSLSPPPARAWFFTSKPLRKRSMTSLW